MLRLLVLLSFSALLAAPMSALSVIDLGVSVGNPPQPLIAVQFDASDVGDSFVIHWALGSALSATGTFAITSYQPDQIVLDIDLTHDTDLVASGLTNAAFMSLGLAVRSDAVGILSASGSLFDSIGAGSGPHQNFPGGFKGIDVCIYAANNCSGGDINQGLAPGASDSFQVTLGGNFARGVRLAAFAAKFQTSRGSFEIPGGGKGPVIPEPSSALLFPLGVGIAVVTRRRAARS